MTIEIMPGEVTPTLFVGLGGSGGRAIARVAERLRSTPEWDAKYRDLVRFVAIDTNEADLAHLRGLPNGGVEVTIGISDFDKVEYTKLRRGEAFAAEDEYFTQWVHPWYRFREESGAGAGQIRIESRLGFFRAAEVGDVTRKLQDVIQSVQHHSHGMRRHGAPLQVFVYFSVAGGTGSGAFLPLSYLLRDIIGDDRARLFGFAILPDAFEEKVGMNREGTLANGYAALKEAEHLMKLDAQAPPNELTFHYDPRDKSKRTITRRPYDILYLVDRPSRFSVGDVGEALADATYVQIFSPILGEQQADYDNYTKESRALFPPELGDDGYTAFFGTLGASLLLLPREDLLTYCARRYAATAVRRYLLMDDPNLVSDAQRERFRAFLVDPDELAALSPEAQAERLDASFQQKMDLLAEEDREGGVWKRLLKVKDTAGTALESQLQAIEDELKGLTAKIREISADRILDDQWTPAATVSGLNREVAEARAAVEARTATHLKRLELGDWWAEFLAEAGPSGAPELDPYEQRYVLTTFRRQGGMLAGDAIDERAERIARLRKEADLGRDSRFRSEMDAHAAEIKKTYGGWDKLITRKDTDFEQARDRTVASFNQNVDKQRALIIQQAMHEILSALGRTADRMRASFRNVESSASRLADELEEKARRFEYDGGLVGSQSNDYLLDVEVLQHPTSRTRFWGWYYADQVQSRPEIGDPKAVLAAVRDAMRPKRDPKGRPIERTAREMVTDVESALVGVARSFLSKTIMGDPESDDEYERAGLRMDDALLLEARYYALQGGRPDADPTEALKDEAPLLPSKLREDDQLRRYARRKLDATLGKAEPLTRYSPEAKSTLKHADMVLLGLHETVEKGLIGELMEEATEGRGAEVLRGWPDPERLVIYHSILGVPLFAFPHLNAEMKHAYRRFQQMEEGKDKAWPLHIDHHWEGLPDLDPTEARQTMLAAQERTRLAIAALVLGRTEGTVVHDDDGYKLSLGEGVELPLGVDPMEAAEAMLATEDSKPAIYDTAVSPLVDAARKATESNEGKAALQAAGKNWKSEAVKLELKDDRDAAEEKRYQALRRSAALIDALLG